MDIFTGFILLGLWVGTIIASDPREIRRVNAMGILAIFGTLIAIIVFIVLAFLN